MKIDHFTTPAGYTLLHFTLYGKVVFVWFLDSILSLYSLQITQKQPYNNHTDVQRANEIHTIKAHTCTQQVTVNKNCTLNYEKY